MRDYVLDLSQWKREPQKDLFTCVQVDASATPIGLGGPCPCGEGRVTMIDYGDWVMEHSGSGPSHGRRHRLPPRVVEVKTTVHYRSKP